MAFLDFNSPPRGDENVPILQRFKVKSLISTHPREGTKTRSIAILSKFHPISTHPREGTKT